MRKRKSFQQTVPKLDMNIQKIEVGLLQYITHTQINSKWVKDLKARPLKKNHKTHRRKHREKFHDTGFANGFLDMTPKAQTTTTTKT